MSAILSNDYAERLKDALKKIERLQEDNAQLKDLFKKYLLHLIDVEGDLLLFRVASDYDYLTTDDKAEISKLLMDAYVEYKINQ